MKLRWMRLGPTCTNTFFSSEILFCHHVFEQQSYFTEGWKDWLSFIRMRFGAGSPQGTLFNERTAVENSTTEPSKHFDEKTSNFHCCRCVFFYYRGTYESFGTKLVQVTLDSRSRTQTRARLRLLTIRSELLDLDVVDNSNDDGNDGVSLAHWETSPSRAPDCRRIASDFELRLKKAKEMQPCSTNHVCAPPHDWTWES